MSKLKLNTWSNYYPCGYYSSGGKICKSKKNITAYRMGKNSMKKLYDNGLIKGNKNVIEKFEGRKNQNFWYSMIICIIIMVFFLFN